MYSQLNNSEASLPSPSSSQSHLSTPPPTPPRPVRKQPQQIRLQPIGVDPNCIVGKVLTCVRRSPIHPSVSLDFADDTTYQLRVDGYSPTFPGIPREFEMNSAMYPLLHAEGGRADVRLTVSHCRFVSLTDTAHDIRGPACRWSVDHLALALKFEEEDGWHCVWASMAEYDGRFGPCMFRSFDDVYLDEIKRSPRRLCKKAKSGTSQRKSERSRFMSCERVY